MSNIGSKQLENCKYDIADEEAMNLEKSFKDPRKVLTGQNGNKYMIARPIEVLETKDYYKKNKFNESFYKIHRAEKIASTLAGYQLNYPYSRYEPKGKTFADIYEWLNRVYDHHIHHYQPNVLESKKNDDYIFNKYSRNKKPRNRAAMRESKY